MERFSGELASGYAHRVRRLIPDYDALHRAVASRAAGVRSLVSVGCGDGEDLFRSDAGRLVGTDPSPAMIAMARSRLGERAQLLVGDPSELTETFEAVTAILVGHFVRFGEKDGFYQSLRERCEGKLIVAELMAPIDAEVWIERMIANGTGDEKARAAVESALQELFPMSESDLIATVERVGFQFEERFWSVSPFAAFSFRAS